MGFFEETGGEDSHWICFSNAVHGQNWGALGKEDTGIHPHLQSSRGKNMSWLGHIISAIKCASSTWVWLCFGPWLIKCVREKMRERREREDIKWISMGWICVRLYAWELVREGVGGCYERMCLREWGGLGYLGSFRGHLAAWLLDLILLLTWKSASLVNCYYIMITLCNSCVHLFICV